MAFSRPVSTSQVCAGESLTARTPIRSPVEPSRRLPKRQVESQDLKSRDFCEREASECWGAFPKAGGWQLWRVPVERGRGEAGGYWAGWGRAST